MYDNIGQAKMAVAGLQGNIQHGGLMAGQVTKLPEIKRINGELEQEITSLRLVWEQLANRLGDVIETFPSNPKDSIPTPTANSTIGGVMVEHVLKVREVREQMALILDRLAI